MTADQLIDKMAAAICDAYEAYTPVPGVLRSEAPNIARALVDAGLLHDHAECLEINRGWQAYKQRKIEERRELTAERDGFYRQWMSTRETVHKQRAQIAKALALIDEATSMGPYFLSPDETRALRALLVAAQP